MEKYLYIALFAPLAGAIFSAFFGNTPKRLLTGIVNSSLLTVVAFKKKVLFGKFHA